MHRFSSYVWLLLVAALYVSAGGCATPQSPRPVESRPPAPVVVPSPTTAQVEPPVVEPELHQAQPQPDVDVQPLTLADTTAPVLGENAEPHIALLLPINSPAFERAAEAVRQGFYAAAGSQKLLLPLKTYASVEESKDIVALYRLALANGAVAVAGPLTRDGVTALAEYSGIAVPTLALNAVESKNSDRLYFFGLSVEAEARQVAQLASAAKLRYATLVSTGTPLAKRLTAAFADEWRNLGGSVTEEILYKGDPAVLALLPTDPGAETEMNVLPVEPPPDAGPDYIPPPTIAPGNMVFLAAETEKARVIRPYLNAALPVYATSQLFNGNTDTLTNYDLNDVHFVGMPWLLQPDHPAVMIYPRANPPMEPDRERLYALGIDAFRLLNIMLTNSYRKALPLDGVTGRIHLINNQFQREAMPAQLKQGRSQITETLPQKIPAR